MIEELFDVCDSEDRVVEVLPRSIVHARKLIHRAVHIFLFDSRDRMLVHRRSASKEEFPLVWTSSASGHVGSGEAYQEAAHREFKEELGLESELSFLNKFPACAETSWEHTCLYRSTTDQVPCCDPEEIIDWKFLSRKELLDWRWRTPGDFSPAFLVLFDWFTQSSG